jgi:hypothetical protein
VIPPGLAAWKTYLFPYATPLTPLESRRFATTIGALLCVWLSRKLSMVRTSGQFYERGENLSVKNLRVKKEFRSLRISVCPP